ncbi:hypothetical protein IAD21_00241 [Abditibacteriota bacterium]|nr:hypothetical protein IAD21_00241 [Abditibacteriota bacterium]
MNRDTLTFHFRQAYPAAVAFARLFVTQELPDAVRFRVRPNQSYDGNPLGGDEETFAHESLPREQYLGPLTEEEVLAWLWRGGKVPEWVDLSTTACDAQFTYVELLCCGRFTANDKHLYHQREGYPPFHVLGPALPPGWKSLEESGKFDLDWREQRRRQ